MQSQNHPRKGSIIKVDPIKSLEAVEKIKRNLQTKPRDYAIFTLGINTNLRASDILRLTLGQVRNVNIGECFTLREKKTSKLRAITMNKTVHEALQTYLATRTDAADSEPLFKSRQGDNSSLCVPYLNSLVKSWCKDIKLKGNFGSHTLRKTFGYMHRTVNNTPLDVLTQMFNHSDSAQTLKYLCIQPEEIAKAYSFEL